MFTKKIITQYVNIIWEETDGCTNQYIYATYFHLLYIISVRFNLIIDSVVEAHGHEENIVDGLNDVDKKISSKSNFWMWQ